MSSDINTSDVTEGKLDGEGSFDLLIASMKQHLLEEFISNRITGPDYANVYLGSLNTVIQQSINFELQRLIASKQADLLDSQNQKLQIEIETDTELRDKQLAKLDAEIKILQEQGLIAEQQVLQAQKNNTLLDIQISQAEKELIIVTERSLAAPFETKRTEYEAKITEVQLDNTSKQGLLLNEEIALTKERVKSAPFETAKTKEESNLIEAQANNENIRAKVLDNESKILEEKVSNTISERENIQSNTAKNNEEIRLISNNSDKVQEEVKLVRANTDNADANTSLIANNASKVLQETALIVQKTANAVKEGNVLDQNILQSQAEVTLTENKAKTEEANFSDTVGGSNVEGTISRKNTLYEKQSDSYLRDAEQKAAKLYGDVLATTLASEAAVNQAIYDTVLGNTDPDSQGSTDFSKVQAIYEEMAIRAGL